MLNLGDWPLGNLMVTTSGHLPVISPMKAAFAAAVAHAPVVHPLRRFFFNMITIIILNFLNANIR